MHPSLSRFRFLLNQLLFCCYMFSSLCICFLVRYICLLIYASLLYMLFQFNSVFSSNLQTSRKTIGKDIEIETRVQIFTWLGYVILLLEICYVCRSLVVLWKSHQYLRISSSIKSSPNFTLPCYSSINFYLFYLFFVSLIFYVFFPFVYGCYERVCIFQPPNFKTVTSKD